MTVNDLENKVRSIDKATNAVASTQPTVAASTDATATSSYPACSASDLNTVSDPDISMKILTSDDNANAADKIKISPSDSDTASDSDISPRRLESTLNAAAASTSSSSIPPPSPPPHLPPIPLPSRSPHIDQSTATASLSEMNPLPSEPISSSYIMDNSQAVPQSSIDQLSYPMREAPRLNPGVEGYVYEAGQIVISLPRKPSLSLTQGDYSRLNANVWLCDATIDFFGQGVLQEETSETHFYSSHFAATLLKFEDEEVQFPNEQTIEHIHQTYVDEDILDIADCGGGGKQDFYDFNRVKTWHESAAKSRGIASIFDLKRLFIPIHKNGNHWLFTMVDMDSKAIGLWEPFGFKVGNRIYLLSIRRYLYDVHVEVFGEDKTDTYDAWTKSWSIIDHSEDWPRQLDGHSCGVFILLGMYHLAHRLELTPSTFSQQDVYNNKIRMRIALVLWLWSYRNGDEASALAPPAAPPAPLCIGRIYQIV